MRRNCCTLEVVPAGEGVVVGKVIELVLMGVLGDVGVQVVEVVAEAAKAAAAEEALFCRVGLLNVSGGVSSCCTVMAMVVMM